MGAHNHSFSNQPWVKKRLRACPCFKRKCCAYRTCPLYNEVILLAAELQKPGAIAAIFYLDARASDSKEQFAAGEEVARKVHRSARFKHCADAPMLVTMDPRREAPFALAVPLDDTEGKAAQSF